MAKIDWRRTIDFAPYWDEICEVAKQRTINRKKDGSHVDPEDPECGEVGVTGEWIYAILFGYEMPTAGVPDGGADYGGCNVKATKYRTGHLIVEIVTTKWPIWFALVVIDLQNRTGRLIGWVTKEEIQDAPQKRLIKNGKINFTLRQDQLHPWPDDLTGG